MSRKHQSSIKCQWVGMPLLFLRHWCWWWRLEDHLHSTWIQPDSSLRFNSPQHYDLTLKRLPYNPSSAIQDTINTAVDMIQQLRWMMCSRGHNPHPLQTVNKYLSHFSCTKRHWISCTFFERLHFDVWIYYTQDWVVNIALYKNW